MNQSVQSFSQGADSQGNAYDDQDDNGHGHDGNAWNTSNNGNGWSNGNHGSQGHCHGR